MANEVINIIVTNAPSQSIIDLTEEIQNRVAGDALNAATIATETSDRQAADAVIQADVDANQVVTDAHIANTSNPHQTTLEQARTQNATLAGAIAMGNNKITGLATPTLAADAVTKSYADAISTAVSDEAAARISGDAANSTEVSNEAAIRSSADTTINNRIDNLTTTNVPEGSRLYFTDLRAISAPLTGLSVLVGTAVTATDSLLIAAGKLQKQITDEATTRANADTTNSTATSNEATARQNADTALGTRIDNLTTSDVPEGSRLYFTNARVQTYGDTVYTKKAGDTITGDFLFAGSKGIDTTAGGASDTLPIGVTNADIINIGRAGVAVNIYGDVTVTGDVFRENVTNLYVQDKLFTINAGGATTSGSDSGFEIEEGVVITGYFKTNATRNGWLFKAPAIAFDAGLSLSNLTANRTFTLPDLSGTLVLESRSIATGTGLTGGGDLSANRTLTLDTAYTDARYILNQTSAQASSNFNISGTGKMTYLSMTNADNLGESASVLFANATGTNNAASKLIDLQVGGATKFSVNANTGFTTIGTIIPGNSTLLVNRAGTTGGVIAADLDNTLSLGASDTAYLFNASNSSHNASSTLVNFASNSISRLKINASTGRVGFGIDPLAGVKVLIRGEDVSAPATSGTVPLGVSLRLLANNSGGLIDMGVADGGVSWLQATDLADLSQKYTISLNPNGGKVAIGTLTPNTSAILDIVSTSQAVLLPRMTTAQRNAGITGVNGMIIYNTDIVAGGKFQGYENGAWVNLV